MSSIRYYPSGILIGPFDNRSFNKKLLVTKPDEEITNLYKLQQTTFLNAQSFEFKKMLFTNVYRLYGESLYDFFRLQLTSNNFIHGSNQDFLIDTLRFIQTGDRRMSVDSWLRLLTFYPDSTPHKQKITDEEVLTLLHSMRVCSSEDMMIRWTTKPAGFYDMLYTTYLLFGNASNVKI